MTEEKKYDAHHGYSEHHEKHEEHKHNTGGCCKENYEGEAQECCKDREENEKAGSVGVNEVKAPSNLNQMLIGALALVVVVNILVMGYFTYSVNNKLDDAIDLTKPQEGKVTLVTADNCALCGDLAIYKKALSAQNVELSDDLVVSGSSEEGKKLISDFGLKMLPALVFVADDEIKSNISKALEKDSRKIENNVIVWEKSYAPYFDIDSNQILGMVNVVYLTDKRCKDCYNAVQVHRPILQNMGIAIAKDEQVDVLDEGGKELVKKYNIQNVPMIILSSEAAAYEGLSQLWAQVGTIEDDGNYIFRKIDLLNVKYKDLTTGRVIEPPPSAQVQ